MADTQPFFLTATRPQRILIAAPVLALRHPWGFGVCLTPVDEPRCGCGHFLLTWHVVVEHEGGGDGGSGA